MQLVVTATSSNPKAFLILTLDLSKVNSKRLHTCYFNCLAPVEICVKGRAPTERTLLCEMKWSLCRGPTLPVGGGGAVGMVRPGIRTGKRQRSGRRGNLQVSDLAVRPAID